MYYTNKVEFQCYDINGRYQGTAPSLDIAAEKAGDGGEIIREHAAGRESEWTVRDGLVYRK